MSILYTVYGIYNVTILYAILPGFTLLYIPHDDWKQNEM